MMPVGTGVAWFSGKTLGARQGEKKTCLLTPRRDVDSSAMRLMDFSHRQPDPHAMHDRGIRAPLTY